jgi:hypothetical protein
MRQMRETTLRAQHARMAESLRAIVAMSKSFAGDTDEREQNDMEDAFSNGCDVGRFEALLEARRVATSALRGVPRPR